MEDFANALSFELRHEIATRYFGLRKEIEKSSATLVEEAHQLLEQYLPELECRLAWIRIALVTDRYFDQFLKIFNIPESLIHHCIDYHVQKNSSPWPGKHIRFPRKIRPAGFSQKRRYRNLVTQITEQFFHTLSPYAASELHIREEREDLVTRITSFERQYDISLILGFFRQLDGLAEPGLAGELGPISGQNNMGFNESMRLLPPQLPTLLFNDPQSCSRSWSTGLNRNRLSNLCDQIYASHGGWIRENLFG